MYKYFIIKVLKKAGADGKATVFLFNDNQIKHESFVEDINMILNTGDVPNLYPADEKAEILEKMQAAARETVCIDVFNFIFHWRNKFMLILNNIYFLNICLKAIHSEIFFTSSN